MLKALSNWWNRDKIAREQRDAEVAKQLDALQKLMQDQHTAHVETIEVVSASKAQVEAELAETQRKAELAEAEAALLREREAAAAAKRNGKEPWVEIVSADFHDVRGLEIKLDWNEAFVQYLKDEGMTARDDETLVQKWLAGMYHHVVDGLEQKVINESDRPRVNDYL